MTAAPQPGPQPRPQRVLWVIKGLGPGGAERLLAVTAATVDRHRVAVSCAHVLAAKDQLAAELAGAGVDVHSLGAGRGLDPRWVMRLVRLLRRGRYDLVHSHSPSVAVVVRLVVRLGLAGRPRPALVTTEHNAWGTLHPLTRAATRLTSSLDDASISVSDETRASIRPARLRARSEVIVHGIDLADVDAATSRRVATRATLGLADSTVAVITVANYRAQKNYPNLLNAAAQVLAQRDDVQFLAVGQGPLAGEVAAMHAALGLGDRFWLLGHRTDALDLIAAADVFVLASDYEGLPVALMEALAVGLPIVATKVGGVAETVTPAAGILVPPQQAAALAGALVEMVEMVADPSRLAAATAARAIGARFDARRSSRQIEAIYRRVSRPVGGG